MPDLLLRSLTGLVEPIGLVWLCLWIAVVWLWIKQRRGVAGFLAVVALFLSVVGGTRVPGDLLTTLERPFVIRELDKLPACDAVVVLGGGVRASKYDAAGMDLSSAGDRLVMGLELIRRGKARHLAVGGAGRKVNGRPVTEADLVNQWIAAWQLPKVTVYSLGACKNTHDEAVRVAALRKEFGWRNVLLVTSAYHMKRAQAVFRTAGVPVVCLACDFQTAVSIESADPEFVVVPRLDGLQKFSIFAHEEIGWWMYRWRGWIEVQGTNGKS